MLENELSLYNPAAIINGSLLSSISIVLSVAKAFSRVFDKSSENCYQLLYWNYK